MTTHSGNSPALLPPLPHLLAAVLKVFPLVLHLEQTRNKIAEEKGTLSQFTGRGGALLDLNERVLKALIFYAECLVGDI